MRRIYPPKPARSAAWNLQAFGRLEVCVGFHFFPSKAIPNISYNLTLAIRNDGERRECGFHLFHLEIELHFFLKVGWQIGRFFKKCLTHSLRMQYLYTMYIFITPIRIFISTFFQANSPLLSSGSSSSPSSYPFSSPSSFSSSSSNNPLSAITYYCMCMGIAIIH